MFVNMVKLTNLAEKANSQRPCSLHVYDLVHQRTLTLGHCEFSFIFIYFIFYPERNNESACIKSSCLNLAVDMCFVLEIRIHGPLEV